MAKSYKIKTPYYEGTVHLVFTKYTADNSPALMLVEARTNEPVATASVCVEGANLQPGEIAIKGWSENDGLPAELVRLGVIGPVKRAVATGYVAATIHDLLIQA